MPRRIGGSDIAALIGVSTYKSPLDVYRRIVEGVEPEPSEIMDRGQALEPVLRAYGQQEVGVRLEDRESDLCIHPSNDFAHAQVDDFAEWRGVPVVVEYKTRNANARRGFGPMLSDQIPEQYRAQLAWQLACADRELGLLIVGFGEDAEPPEIFTLHNVVTYTLDRDGAYESYLLRVAREFWDEHVIPKIPPGGHSSVRPVTKRKQGEAQ